MREERDSMVNKWLLLLFGELEHVLFPSNWDESSPLKCWFIDPGLTLNDMHVIFCCDMSMQ